jgi:hypothetical protein
VPQVGGVTNRQVYLKIFRYFNLMYHTLYFRRDLFKLFDYIAFSSVQEHWVRIESLRKIKICGVCFLIGRRIGIVLQILEFKKYDSRNMNIILHFEKLLAFF